MRLSRNTLKASKLSNAKKKEEEKKENTLYFSGMYSARIVILYLKCL